MEIAVLSKSRFTLFCQCLKVLWMRVHKPELAMVDDSMEARFEQGNLIVTWQRGCLGNGKDLGKTKRSSGIIWIL